MATSKKTKQRTFTVNTFVRVMVSRQIPAKTLEEALANAGKPSFDDLLVVEDGVEVRDCTVSPAGVADETAWERLFD